MATNREKYIESLSNRELADLLANKCNIYKNKINTYSDETKEAVDIEIWLSQEAEETQKEDNNKTIFIPLPKDEITSKAIETLLLELHKMSARLDKLEESEYHNAMAIERLEKINEYESNIDDVETKSADEMLEELGYTKVRDDNYGTHIIIYSARGGDTKIDIKMKNNQYFYMKTTSAVNQEISLKEDIAIHKKISELKGEWKNGQ